MTKLSSTRSTGYRTSSTRPEVDLLLQKPATDGFLTAPETAFYLAAGAGDGNRTRIASLEDQANVSGIVPDVDLSTR